MILSILLVTISILLFLLHRKNEEYFNYWTKRGFPQVKPMFLVGNFLEKFFSRYSLSPYFANMYNKYKKDGMKALGFYSFYTPSLLILDPELLQDILIKDFDSFHDRVSCFVSASSPLSYSIFNMVGHRWRNFRAQLTPAFTTANLKKMLPVMNECGKILEEYLTKNAKTSEGKLAIEMRDIMTRYNLTLSSSRDFGIENDCINDPSNPFRVLSLYLTQFQLLRVIRNTIRFLIPQVLVYFHWLNSKQHYHNYIIDMVQQQIECRKDNNERKDLMQLLIELMNKGFISVDKSESKYVQEEYEVQKLTFNEVASQAFFFFLAGYEGSANTMTYLLFELCKHPHMQQKVHEEIDCILKENDGEMSYETLKKMSYLECCLNETFRKYPVGIPFRLCGKDYQISGTDLTIEKGTIVFLPVLGIQRDPQYFEDPLEFKPERFFTSPTGNKAPGITFFPFGEGRRSCIGMRLAKLQMKIGIVSLLSKFSVELVDKKMMEREIEFDSYNTTLTPKKAIFMNLTLRE